MSQFTEYEITEAMVQFGGGFVQQLARLYRQADVINKSKLREAFPEYWAQYTELARMLPERTPGETT